MPHHTTAPVHPPCQLNPTPKTLLPRNPPPLYETQWSPSPAGGLLLSSSFTIGLSSATAPSWLNPAVMALANAAALKVGLRV